ncbi:MAG: Reverse transcriptase protein [Campylobacterota bacterium]|nr:Reverse transcriptase protein [Campylobacterota bacterium]
MPIMSKFEFIDEIDLYRAYKKTKFELFNDRNSVLTLKLFNFEKDLEKNISNLYKKLQKNLILKVLENFNHTMFHQSSHLSLLQQAFKCQKVEKNG